MNNKKTIELLSPAKNADIGISAIKFGADAVYIGASEFSARSSAHNSLPEIERLIKFAHIYNSKVYVTLNTILNDTEILKAEKLINELYNIGTDGIIIQDLGILECDIPPVPLIASTQIDNRTWQKVKFFEDLNFKRVILARELSAMQIKEISSKTKIELEFFVHGALCFSFSGKCYLSYAIGKRSSNRGECAQPCRKKYSIKYLRGEIIAKDKHLMCMKDLNLSNHLNLLIDSGITSFKIEGRLKDENYVKNITAFYRQKLDAVLSEKKLNNSSLGKIIYDFSPDPYKTFNRGYTDYFINGKNRNILSLDTPKSLGEMIAKIKYLKKQSFHVDYFSEEKLNIGDGICFLNSNGDLCGTYIKSVENKQIFPVSMKYITENAIIYRNFNKKFTDILQSSKTNRKISIAIKISGNSKKLLFTVTDQSGISTDLELNNNFPPALNKKIVTDNYRKQLSKLNDTQFKLDSLSIYINELYFIPFKELNNIRRTLIIKHTENILSAYKNEKLALNNVPFHFFDKDINCEDNIFNQRAVCFYRKHGAVNIEKAYESGINMKSKAVMTSINCLKFIFGVCPAINKNTADKDIILTDEMNKDYRITTSCDDCIMHVFY